MSQSEDRLREYVTETYRIDDQRVLALLRRYISNQGLWDPDWQVAVLKGRVGVVITERPKALERIWVLGLLGEEVLFRRDQD